jgi:Alpha-tubulin suppressor and related RCC1 domain-containing proteins
VIFSATGRFAYETIAAGSEFSCGISTAGIVYCWGRNDRGQIGNGNVSDQFSPVSVAGAFQFVAIGLGDSHACGIARAVTRSVGAPTPMANWEMGPGRIATLPTRWMAISSSAALMAASHTVAE